MTMKGFFMKNCEKIFGFTNKSGILMPISSLPNEYGIGSFGKSAFDFVDFLDRCGQTCWQVLPLNPTSYGDSPYQSPASVAGNPYFIDLDILAGKGLLNEKDLSGEKADEGKVNYGKLFFSRYNILRVAYSRFVPDEEYNSFCADNSSWLEDYALFMALKVKYNHASWITWEPQYRNCASARERAYEFSNECGFWKWLQFEFMSEWNALHEYARSKGIMIIGDMPIYVAHDSMDVWRAPDQFLLDENYNPTVVAGCPPDAYSVTGQKWGNPIYNWEKMQDEGFRWWIDRVGCAFSLFDLLRIDHFRGFASYFSIPADAENAINGEWCDAPGKELFETIKAAFPDGKIIAEDLGYITDDVRELLAYTSFPGMKILQFAFGADDSEYLPRMFETNNCIVYTSSHDSDCTRSWYESLDEESLARFKKEYKIPGRQTPTAACINFAMKSIANLCIISMQDYLELTNEEGRMNVPSKPDGNWGWRIDPGYDTKKLEKKIYSYTEKANRLKA
ncbi:MAG: 4-alpha-glucanotransferase [Eubacteriales bacterium]